jgi:hypothetical protein
MRPLPRLAAALVAAALFAAPLRADDLTDVRSQAGARLFRALLSADTDIDKKTADNKLLIVFLYVDDQARAAALAQRFLGDTKDIHGIPLAIEFATDPTLAAYKSRVPAGIFIAQPFGSAALKSVVGFGIEHHVIVYSPFEGNVESGVTGGLAVEAQVRPYVNLATLTASSISLKPLFFKVTKVFR